MSETYNINRKTWEETLKLSKTNPALMMKAGLDLLTSVTDGKLDFVDASTPASLLMEFSAQLAANNFGYFSESDAKHYPILATKMEDLYHHMSNELYRGRFATPSTGVFTLSFRLRDILEKSTEIDKEGNRKLIIPRGATIQADGIPFTIISGVEILVSAYDAVQVIYSKHYHDTFEPLRSNILEYYFAYNPYYGEDALFIEIPIMQLQLTRKESDITHVGNMYNEIHQFNDRFVGARVYTSNEHGEIKELKTTSGDLIYDPHNPTARVVVLSNNLVKISIPPIYYNTKQLNNMNIITEIYTTKGQVSVPLKSISDNKGFGISFNDDGSLLPGDSIYTSPWSSIDMHAFCRADNSGGNDGIEFQRIKKWVVEGGADKEMPITTANLKMAGDLRGYDIVLDVDNVTSRVFQATREIEKSTSGEFHRGIGCSIESVPMKVSELEGHPHVNSHGERLTILPTALFKTVNGITSILWDGEVPTLTSSGSMDTYISDINKLEYVYTPFYYCLDHQDGFDMRVYHMDRPEVLAQRFIDNNTKTQLLVSSDDTRIRRTERGYTLRVRTRSSDNYKEIHYSQLFAQLAFKPEDQIDLAYINGRFIGMEDNNHVWEFDLQTTFDFTKQDAIVMNNFKIITQEQRQLGCPLTGWFSLFFGVYDIDLKDEMVTQVDSRLGKHILDHRRRAYGLTENQVQIKLGYALTDLWRNARTTESTLVYKRYPHSIPLTYTENIYRTGEDGLPIYTTGRDGKFEFEIEHRIGDVVRDEQGEIVMKHRAGDVMLDETGKAIVERPKSVLRILDILFIDGIYRFSTSEEDITYANSIADMIVNWIDIDIKILKSRLLEKTSLFFTPKRTMGYINIIAENSQQKAIFNRLPFKVKFYLTNRGYVNEDYRRSLTAMTYRIINEALKEKTISKDIIENMLRTEGGKDNILGVNVVDMGVGSDINTFTILGSGNQCSVRRKIGLQVDGTLKVKEDISIEFINHELSQLKKEKRYEQH